MLPTCEAADPNPRRPRFKVPKGAVDCHAHIFGPEYKFPYAKDRTYTPPDASLANYLNLLKTLRVARGVLVQPSVYGLDNSRLIDALSEAGQNFRGVAVVDATCRDDELDRLHAVGVRGVRINVVFGGGAALLSAQALALRIKRLGWHLQFLIDVSTQPDLNEFVSNLCVPIVIDHMGHISSDRGVENPGFQALLALVSDQDCWVKLSGSYRLTTTIHPPYLDVADYARALVRAAPHRCVWATDWPHPKIDVPMPNDGDLMDQLIDWIPDSKTLERVLVDNPKFLYGFD